MSHERHPRLWVATLVALCALSGLCRTTFADGDGCETQDFETTRFIISNTADGAISIVAANMDGDDDLDVVAASANDDTIAWYESNGESPPTFTEHIITSNSDGVFGVYAADLDGDGDTDVVAGVEAADTIVWYENDGGSPPSFTEHIITDTADRARNVFIADVDGGEHMDVLAAIFTDDVIAWYESDGGSPPIFTEHVITDTANGAMSVFAADLDGDMDTDVVSASQNDFTIAWYESDGASPPNFTEHVISDSALQAQEVYVADVNGDTRPDVVAVSKLDDTVAWYENDGASPPNFIEHVITTTANGARTVFAADMDGDLDVDVVVGSQIDGRIRWFENDGGSPPSFTEQIITTTATNVRSVFAANLDDSPNLEILAALFVPDRLAWYAFGPPVLGSCCLPDVSCVESICVADCAALGGWTWTAETACLDVTCFGQDTPAAVFVDALSMDTFRQIIIDLVAFGTRHWSRPENLLAVDYIKEKLESFGYDNVTLDPYIFQNQLRHNVYATKMGVVRPKEMYILGAHLDSFNINGDQSNAPGADDDGSGTSSVLEMARVFAKARTDVSIRFVLWNNEETGLDGSEAYVINHELLQGTLEEPTWLGMIQQDMILYDHGPGKIPDADVEYQAAQTNNGRAIMLADFVAGAMARYGEMPVEVGDNMDFTDSKSFQGATAAISVRENQRVSEIGNGSNPHYHQPTDLPETYTDADYEFGFNILRMIAGAIGEVSGAIFIGDQDGDQDVDLIDFEAFLECVTGPGGVAAPECDVFDADGDGDVDWTDYRSVQLNFTGPL